MLATLEQLRAALQPLGYPVHLLYAEGPDDSTHPPVPYLTLEVDRGPTPDELPLCDPGSAIQFRLQVRAVGYPADSPVKVQQRVRDVLAPGRQPTRLVGGGRVVDMLFLGAEVHTMPDRDMTAANLNRHPSWGLDAYDVHVQATAPTP